MGTYPVGETMRYRIFPLEEGHCSADVQAGFSLLAHPALRRHLLSSQAPGSALNLAATALGRPVGLLIASLSVESKSADLLSLFVNPQWRPSAVAARFNALPGPPL